MVKDFTFYIEKGDVKKQQPDRNLSKATLNESQDRLQLASKLNNLAKPKYILENAYEAIREGADSILYNEGYKSYSHEASIIYLLKKGFSESVVNEIDRFRKIRNGIKYYGRDCDKEDADSALRLAKEIIPKIKSIIEGHQ